MSQHTLIEGINGHMEQGHEVEDQLQDPDCAALRGTWNGATVGWVHRVFQEEIYSMLRVGRGHLV